jgi:peptidoglycan hydrolase-like protein with peptidoglycan-binding domain
VGFTTLAALQGTHGRLEGFRAYNGTGAAGAGVRGQGDRRRDQWLASLRDAARPTLRQGDRGVDVERLQRALKVEPVSGWYGPLTVAAVRRFQAGHQLVVDGIAGPATWAELDR